LCIYIYIYLAVIRRKYIYIRSSVLHYTKTVIKEKKRKRKKKINKRKKKKKKKEKFMHYIAIQSNPIPAIPIFNSFLAHSKQLINLLVEIVVVFESVHYKPLNRKLEKVIKNGDNPMKHYRREVLMRKATR